MKALHNAPAKTNRAEAGQQLLEALQDLKTAVAVSRAAKAELDSAKAEAAKDMDDFRDSMLRLVDARLDEISTHHTIVNHLTTLTRWPE